MGISFNDLYELSGLKKIDNAFLKYLLVRDELLYDRIIKCRADQVNDTDLMIDLAQILEEFIAKLFDIEGEVNKAAAKHQELLTVCKCKKEFVRRYALSKYKDCPNINIDEHEEKLAELMCGDPKDEILFSKKVIEWLYDEEKYKSELDLAAQYASFKVKKLDSEYRGILYKFPEKLDFESLLDLVQVNSNGGLVLQSKNLIHRDGFDLTDNDASNDALSLDQVKYCIYCHKRDKDSCSKGLKDKDGGYKVSHGKVKLEGCPLEEKISEMNMIKGFGCNIAALAVICIDNPMCAGTGHRICNDCMRSCIYQVQEPVNVPLIETNILDDVLVLPYGFEIYSLLTKWNPMNFLQPLPKDRNNRKVLVVGMGPAGYTLSHYLLRAGCAVVGIDALKIEPLSEDLVINNFVPIKHVEDELHELLSERSIQGFGGVSEYGITIRWNKNYLKIIRLILERNSNFRLFGGVRFGSNISYNNAMDLGFDHISLAVGAGRPNMLTIKGSLTPGVRTSSDFLMALQLTGAFKQEYIANLQIRMPIVVIGGGLTAVDTATEALSYYILQVEKFKYYSEKLTNAFGSDYVNDLWSMDEILIVKEYLEHASLFEDERMQAKKEGRDPNFIRIIKDIGGVNIVYRKTIQESPSYRMNHEELQKAMEEGIGFIENMKPLEFIADESGKLSKIKMLDIVCNKEESIAARSAMIAIGTNPNNMFAKEYPRKFKESGKYLTFIDEKGNEIEHEYSTKAKEVNVISVREKDGRSISVIGDLHPVFEGNVVKAMASAKRAAPIIMNEMQYLPSNDYDASFFSHLRDTLTATVEKVEVIAQNIVEIVVKSKLAAENFQPGQFYRLQNYESNAIQVPELRTKLCIEGLALTGSVVDKSVGTISLIILEVGASSSLCRFLQRGEKVVLMGPTGSPTFIPHNQKVMLVGGGLGNAVLFSIGKAMRDKGCDVTYFAGYRNLDGVYKREAIADASDRTIWACDMGDIPVTRDEDISFQGNIVEAIRYYHKSIASLSSLDRIIMIGSDKMMHAVAQASRELGLSKQCEVIASINSPMQCMMKEVCGQCLQRHVCLETGRESYVYSCCNQDQDVKYVDFLCLHDRLSMNNIQEKLVNLWVKYALTSV